MKKIIDGKLYDTETAKEIGEYSYGAINDFRYFSETLYKTKNGNYFMYGEGGALSQYAEVSEFGKCGGCAIVPYTEEEAQKWAEDYLDVDEYLKIFGADSIEEA